MHKYLGCYLFLTVSLYFDSSICTFHYRSNYLKKWGVYINALVKHCAPKDVFTSYVAMFRHVSSCSNVCHFGKSPRLAVKNHLDGNAVKYRKTVINMDFNKRYVMKTEQQFPAAICGKMGLKIRKKYALWSSVCPLLVHDSRICRLYDSSITVQVPAAFTVNLTFQQLDWGAPVFRCNPNRLTLKTATHLDIYNLSGNSLCGKMPPFSVITTSNNVEISVQLVVVNETIYNFDFYYTLYYQIHDWQFVNETYLYNYPLEGVLKAYWDGNAVFKYLLTCIPPDVFHVKPHFGLFKKLFSLTVYDGPSNKLAILYAFPQDTFENSTTHQILVVLRIGTAKYLNFIVIHFRVVNPGYTQTFFVSNMTNIALNSYKYCDKHSLTAGCSFYISNIENTQFLHLKVNSTSANFLESFYCRFGGLIVFETTPVNYNSLKIEQMVMCSQQQTDGYQVYSLSSSLSIILYFYRLGEEMPELNFFVSSSSCIGLSLVICPPNKERLSFDDHGKINLLNCENKYDLSLKQYFYMFRNQFNMFVIDIQKFPVCFALQFHQGINVNKYSSVLWDFPFRLWIKNSEPYNWPNVNRILTAWLKPNSISQSSSELYLLYLSGNRNYKYTFTPVSVPYGFEYSEGLLKMKLYHHTNLQISWAGAGLFHYGILLFEDTCYYEILPYASTNNLLADIGSYWRWSYGQAHFCPNHWLYPTSNATYVIKINPFETDLYTSAASKMCGQMDTPSRMLQIFWQRKTGSNSSLCSLDDIIIIDRSKNKDGYSVIMISNLTQEGKINFGVKVPRDMARSKGLDQYYESYHPVLIINRRIDWQENHSICHLLFQYNFSCLYPTPISKYSTSSIPDYKRYPNYLHFHLVDKSYYVFPQSYLTWEQGLDKCRSLYSTLLEFYDHTEEINFLQYFHIKKLNFHTEFSCGYPCMYFVGFKRGQEDRLVKWLSGGPTSYQNWQTSITYTNAKYLSYTKTNIRHDHLVKHGLNYCLHNTECPVENTKSVRNEVGDYLDKYDLQTVLRHQETSMSLCGVGALSPNMQEFQWLLIPCNKPFHNSIVCTRRDKHPPESYTRPLILVHGLNKNIHFLQNDQRISQIYTAGYTLCRDSTLTGEIPFDKQADVNGQYIMPCSVSANPVICPLHTYQCHDFTCILYLYVCDGVADCTEGEDELCQRLCSAVLSSGSYKYTVCGNEDCACETYNYVNCLCSRCKNDKIHCGSDFGFFHDIANAVEKLYNSMSGNYSHHIDDLHTSMTKGLDEDFVSDWDNVWVQKHSMSDHSLCSNGQLPCQRGSSTCYNKTYECVFDINTQGYLKHCRNGGHMADCYNHSCSGYFKCPNSFCLPVYRICNGVQDCVGNEDEENCINLVCEGFFKCKNGICLDFANICDGEKQCTESEDDELFCNFQKCPLSCYCIGLTIVCSHTSLSEIGKLKILFSSMEMHLNITDDQLHLLSHFPDLLLLDLSHNNIIQVCIESSRPFKNLNLLKYLDIRFNKISALSNECFFGLHSLKYISLEGNPIVWIGASVWIHSLYLTSLNLKLPINNLSSRAFNGIPKLESLTISVKTFEWINNNLFSYINNLTFLSLTVINTLDNIPLFFYKSITVDNLQVNIEKLCCIARFLKKCTVNTLKVGVCTHIIEHSGVQFFLSIISVAILFFNAVAFFMRLQGQINANKALLGMLHLVDLLLGLYLLLLEVANVSMQHLYALNHTQWLSNYYCQILVFLSGFSIHLSNYVVAVLSCIRLHKIKNIRTVRISRRSLHCFYAGILLWITFIVLPLLFDTSDENFSHNQFCFVYKIPFHISSHKMIFILILVIGNIVSMFVTVFTHICIYRSAHASKRYLVEVGLANVSHVQIKKGMLGGFFILIMPQLLCWTLIYILMMVKTESLSREVQLIIIIFSSLVCLSNPFLNTLRRTEKEQKRKQTT